MGENMARSKIARPNVIFYRTGKNNRCFRSWGTIGIYWSEPTTLTIIEGNVLNLGRLTNRENIEKKFDRRNKHTSAPWNVWGVGGSQTGPNGTSKGFFIQTPGGGAMVSGRAKYIGCGVWMCPVHRMAGKNIIKTDFNILKLSDWRVKSDALQRFIVLPSRLVGGGGIFGEFGSWGQHQRSQGQAGQYSHEDCECADLPNILRHKKWYPIYQFA